MSELVITTEQLYALQDKTEAEQWEFIQAYPKAVKYIPRPTTEQIRYAIKQDAYIYSYYRNRGYGARIIKKEFGTYGGALLYVTGLDLVIANCWAGSTDDFQKECSEKFTKRYADKLTRKIRKIKRKEEAGRYNLLYGGVV